MQLFRGSLAFVGTASMLRLSYPGFVKFIYKIQGACELGIALSRTPADAKSRVRNPTTCARSAPTKRWWLKRQSLVSRIGDGAVAVSAAFGRSDCGMP